MIAVVGEPVELDVRRAGSLPWHPSGATFAGSGRTGDGALFAYGAAWDGAGRWSVEVTTRRRKLVLRPLEELQEQLLGSFALEPVALPGEPAGVKPGLAGQLAAFLSVAGGAPADPALCPLPAAVERLRTASRMLGYDS